MTKDLKRLLEKYRKYLEIKKKNISKINGRTSVKKYQDNKLRGKSTYGRRKLLKLEK